MALPTLRLAERSGVRRLVGGSALLRQVRQRIIICARSSLPVLIEGETGTGKELVARALHEEGPLHRGPFVPVDCGALPEALAEAELFGHRRGAFTGATLDRPGLVAAAEGGTLFLDEIENLPLSVQAKLLRFLQDADYRPLGAARPLRARVRVVAASNRALSELVTCGAFRRDLLFRLDVLRLVLPPLRERMEDLKSITAAVLGRVEPGGELGHGEEPAAEIVRHWATHSWPGNVRELVNVVERARVYAAHVGWPAAWQEATVELLESAGLSPVAESVCPVAPLGGGSALGERGRLEALLDRHRWQRSSAARELGISRVTLWRRMRREGLLGDGAPGPGRLAAGGGGGDS